jgi:hypothetical protein
MQYDDVRTTNAIRWCYNTPTWDPYVTQKLNPHGTRKWDPRGTHMGPSYYLHHFVSALRAEAEIAEGARGLALRFGVRGAGEGQQRLQPPL